MFNVTWFWSRISENKLSKLEKINNFLRALINVNTVNLLRTINCHFHSFL